MDGGLLNGRFGRWQRPEIRSMEVLGGGQGDAVLNFNLLVVNKIEQAIWG